MTDEDEKSMHSKIEELQRENTKLKEIAELAKEYIFDRSKDYNSIDIYARLKVKLGLFFKMDSGQLRIF